MAIDKTLIVAIEGGAPVKYASIGAALAALVNAAITKNDRQAAKAAERSTWNGTTNLAERQQLLTSAAEAAELLALAADIATASAYDGALEGALSGGIVGHVSAVG
jgi:hypothetical protein